MTQTSGKKAKRKMSNKQKAAIKKLQSNPLLKLWMSTLDEVKAAHPNLSLKEAMKKAKPIYQKAKANALKKMK